jgi:hypothetical protein
MILDGGEIPEGIALYNEVHPSTYVLMYTCFWWILATVQAKHLYVSVVILQ